MKKLSNKIIKLLNSDSDGKTLAMEILKKENPAVYVALMNYTGFDILDEAAAQIIVDSCGINIGSKVSYFGAEEDCPTMTVVSCTLKRYINPPENVEARYWVEIEARYYNRITGKYEETSGRLELFKIVK